jgi:pimeloyl-ACP methyl ester carboxylesterase
VRLVLLPGWNEGADDMRIFIDGRHRHPGLAQFGYDCVVYDGGHGSLRSRVEQFADFLTGFRRTRGGPLGTFGYSAGGVIARAFLRAYPERAGEIGAMFQVGVPNAGVVTDRVAAIMHALGIEDDVIEDLDIESPFMAWLNGCPGSWQHVRGVPTKVWRFAGVPWTAPPGIPLFNIVGRMRRYGYRDDGLVMVESATLTDFVRHRFVDGPHANHLNLSGMSNLFTTVFRRWWSTDDYWRLAVREAHDFFGARAYS